MWGGGCFGLGLHLRGRVLTEHMQGLELNPSTKKKEKVERWRDIRREAGKKKKRHKIL